MQQVVSKERREIIPLTSVRGIAAMWVVVFHSSNMLIYRGFIDQPGAAIQNIILGGSDFAVDIFFLLSGYILAETYGTTPNSGAFFAHRVARIFPLHLAVLSTMVVGLATMARFGILPENQEFFSWATLPYNYTLTSVSLSARAH